MMYALLVVGFMATVALVGLPIYVLYGHTTDNWVAVVVLFGIVAALGTTSLAGKVFSDGGVTFAMRGSGAEWVVLIIGPVMSVTFGVVVFVGRILTQGANVWAVIAGLLVVYMLLRIELRVFGWTSNGTRDSQVPRWPPVVGYIMEPAVRAVLPYLIRNGACYANEVAQGVDIDPEEVRRILDYMVKNDLVLRTNNAEVPRGVYSPTKQGILLQGALAG